MGLLASLKSLRKEEVGRAPVPGEATIELPVGKVSLRWEEARAGRNSRNARVRAPGDFELTIVPAAGGTPLVVQPATGGTSGAGGGKIYSPYGSFEVADAGPYRLTATTAESREDAVLIVRA